MAVGSVVGETRVRSGIRRPRNPHGSVTPLRRPALAPTSPPPNYYDPAIDAQVRASGRGLGQLLADTSTARLRGANDYTTARGDVFRQRDQGLSDLLTSYQRGQQDSQLGESRLRQDYGTQIQGLQRGYARLGGQQAQQAAGAGLGSAGVFAQAAAKRAANEAIDQAPVDTGFNRGLADMLSSRSRATQDYGTNVGRTTDAASRAAGQLSLGYGRQQHDQLTAERRATREDMFFGQDANQQRWFQAKQAGYVAPETPARRRGAAGNGGASWAGSRRGLGRRIYEAGGGRSGW
jgi:hypothetical protein